MSAGHGGGMFPLLRLLTGQAPVLIEHAEAYAELAAEELAAAAAATRRRFVALVVALLAAAMALAFGGVALMLWGALPASPDAPARWLLGVVPAVFAIAAIAAVVFAKLNPTTPVFAELRLQWHRDMALIREGLAR